MWVTIILHRYFDHFSSPFQRKIWNTILGCIPTGSFFWCHPESCWCSRSLSVDLLSDLPPGQCLLGCSSATSPPEMFNSISQEALEYQNTCKQSFLFGRVKKKKKEGKTFHSLLTKSQTFPKKVNSFHEKFQLIANHVSSKTSISTVLCLFCSKPFKGQDL